MIYGYLYNRLSLKWRKLNQFILSCTVNVWRIMPLINQFSYVLSILVYLSIYPDVPCITNVIWFRNLIQQLQSTTSSECYWYLTTIELITFLLFPYFKTFWSLFLFPQILNERSYKKQVLFSLMKYFTIVCWILNVELFVWIIQLRLICSCLLWVEDECYASKPIKIPH